MDASGASLWQANGVPICDIASGEYFPQLISDGSGGAIIAWRDSRGSDTDIYIQRVNSSGAVQWATNGVALCTALNPQRDHQLVGDGSGGAIVVWEDLRNDDWDPGKTAEITGIDIYAQRVDATGTVLWTTDGAAICNAANDQEFPQLVSDGAGGAIVVWEDGRSGSDIYAQRLDPSGSALWAADGVAICSATGSQGSPQLVSDGSGGAVLTWRDDRGSSPDIYAQRLDSTGIVLWTSDGIAVSTAPDNQYFPRLVSAGPGRAIATWQDRRDDPNGDIYAQWVGSRLEWTGTSDGEAVYDEANWSDTATASAPAAGSVDPSIDIDQVMTAASGTPGGTNGAGPHFQLGTHGSLDISGATLWRMDLAAGAGIRVLDGYVADQPNRPVSVADTAQLLTQFILQINLSVSGSATVTFNGAGNPVNYSTVALTGYDVTINFLDETVTDFVAEHAGKFTVNGFPAELGNDSTVWETGDNLVAVSDGGSGCIVTAHDPNQADVAISKTDGVTSAVPGESITYTIVASNAGPSNATSVLVSDTFPNGLTCTWTSVASGGATGNTNGSDDINETLDLPAGSSVTYSAPCTIDQSATGTLVNTATISAAIDDPDTGNNSATDDDTVLSPEADLQISKDDAVSEAYPGDTLTYTIVVANAGPSYVADALIEDVFPAELTGCQWSCAAGAGASCTTGPVSGNLNDLADIPASSSVVYTALCTVDSAAAFSHIINTATVTAPVGTADPDLNNNSATDTDLGPLVFTDDFESGDTSSWSATAG